MKDSLTSLYQQFLTELQNATTEQALDQVRVAFLGRSGHMTELMKQLKDLSVDEKRVVGPQLNQLKIDLETSYNKRQEELFNAQVARVHAENKYFDVTAYKKNNLPARLHIYTQIIQELEDIFISMGYDVLDGNEIETDYYNFETLNIPMDHPAKDMHDTFWLNVPGMLMRTHTSNVQAHAMETKRPPMAVFAPGRVYRNEAIDASHEFMFTQAECMFIDKNVSLANLLATAQTFLKKLFQKDDLNIRVRPGYFPFVEPGLEIDVSCPFCSKGCSTCKKTGWIELLGSGLIHPNVLRMSGIDPEIYSGFAFGIGIERLAMIRHGIDDIRLFHSSNISFLDQF
jgi:phenylalanyl-tRNA synthetase alpha chain